MAEKIRSSASVTPVVCRVLLRALRSDQALWMRLGFEVLHAHHPPHLSAGPLVHGTPRPVLWASVLWTPGPSPHPPSPQLVPLRSSEEEITQESGRARKRGVIGMEAPETSTWT